MEKTEWEGEEQVEQGRPGSQCLSVSPKKLKSSLGVVVHSCNPSTLSERLRQAGCCRLELQS